ncbi:MULTISPECIES: heavy-metal-associated domain-containing protein [unclassified Leifsonia]|uniref:heavy-metal-associated domain-containing protein n=1 Tax=unclassified Leifsonia TaxID=2663824 RepID=UPI0006F86096|nr:MULTISPECIES: heavy-metal-associated domain-containing protein [unclassified Leifsonia]KQX07662.1 heavy metal transporter [Leifsonia sp. Root1293]KRA11944.1 heavy metal transporter [Leifsonia sp. Root60]
MSTNERIDLGLTDSASGCSCCSTASTADTPVAASTTSQDVLVDGMTCSHCVMSVTEEISAIDGVENVSVDLNAGGSSRVTIHSGLPIDAARVRAAVEEAGYTVGGSPA